MYNKKQKRGLLPEPSKAETCRLILSIIMYLICSQIRKLLASIKSAGLTEADRKLVLPTAIFSIVVYWGPGLLFATGATSLIPGMSRTEVLCSGASVACIFAYVVHLFAPQATYLEKTRVPRMYCLIVVAIIAGYTGIYLWISLSSGIHWLSALGSAFTLVGLGTVLINYILEVVKREPIPQRQAAQPDHKSAGACGFEQNTKER